MKHFAWIVWSLLALSGMASAQGFGIGLGFFNQDGSGNLHVSVPARFGIAQFEDFGLELQVNADFILTAQPDLGLLISPILSYTFDPIGFTPITLYAGPSFRLLILKVLEDTRSYAWSYVGGLLGAYISLAGWVGAFVESSFSVGGDTPIFSVQTGIGFGY